MFSSSAAAPACPINCAKPVERKRDPKCAWRPAPRASLGVSSFRVSRNGLLGGYNNYVKLFGWPQRSRIVLLRETAVALL